MKMMYLTPIASVLALLFVAYTAKKVLGFSKGTPRMAELSQAISDGASAYLKRQYSVVLIFFGVMFAVLTVMAFAGFLTYYVPFAVFSRRCPVLSA